MTAHLIRCVGLAAAVACLCASPAAGAVCKYAKPAPRPSAAERELADSVSVRRSYGFPSHRRFVRRVNADPASRRRSRMPPYIAVTAREARYLKQRRRLQEKRSPPKLDAYLRRHEDVLGVDSIEDDYPRRPYLLVPATRDLARHRAAIRRWFHLRLRVVRARYSLRQLERVEDSIDEDTLAAEGIGYVGAGIGDDIVELEVTTQRTDAAAVVRRLYGPAVRVIVVGPTPTYLTCGSPDSYTLDADGRTLHLAFADSGSIDNHHVELIEGEDEVRVGIVTENPHGPVTADLHPYTRSVTLAAPLGDRVVRSITTGARVRASTGPRRRRP